MPTPNRFLLTAKNLLALAVFIVCLAVIYQLRRKAPCFSLGRMSRGVAGVRDGDFVGVDVVTSVDKRVVVCQH